MKRISSFQHLEPYGIDPLTGEADALGYRVLCDITAKGRKILLRALGIPDIKLCDPWNTGSASDPHLGSCMIPVCMVEFLAVFAFLEDNATQVWIFKNGCVMGFYPDDTAEEMQQTERFCEGEIRRKIRASSTGDRELHRMSGRYE